LKKFYCYFRKLARALHIKGHNEKRLIEAAENEKSNKGFHEN